MKDVATILKGSTSPGDRLKRLRKANKWSQQEVADRCGWLNNGQSRYSGYERGRIPSPEDLDLLAQIYGVAPQVLLYGQATAFKPQIRRLPVLAWNQLRVKHAGNKKFRSSKPKEFLSVPADRQYGPNVFALHVDNRRMAFSPFIAPGDVLIVDPARHPVTGQYVVADFNGPTLCQWGEDKGKPALRQTPHAKFQVYDPKQVQLFGTVISKITHY